MLRKYFLPFVVLLSISQSRQASGALEVKIKSKNDFCMVVPKDPRTTIGDSERPDGATVWCQNPSGATSSSTGTFNGAFWSNVDVSSPKDGIIQMTGCINVGTCDRLDPNDDGGQYDSNGGSDGLGNPARSFCQNYPSYVQLIEPSAKRACIRCCQNANECDLSRDTSGCPAVIPGNYYDCS